MWRSIASRSCLSRCNFAKKLSSFQNPQSQVTHKPFNSSSSYYYSHFSIFQQPRKTTHQNYRFLSQSSSSINEFEPENNDATSSEKLELGNNDGISNDTHVDKSSDFDGISENKDAHMNISSTNDQKLEVEEGIDVEKLEKVVSLLKSSSIDESLEPNLDKLDLSLNEEFLMKVLKTPLIPVNHLIRFYNWVCDKNAVGITTRVLFGLSRCVCNDPGLKKNDVYALWDLIKGFGVKESGVLNAEILNTLISAFARLYKGKAAFEVFGKFEELGCCPNVDTYYLTFQALKRRKLYDLAMSVCEKMLDAGMIPSKRKVGKIISFYCEGYKTMDAYKFYLAAKEKNMIPPRKNANVLINMLSKEDETVSLAREMLFDFPGKPRRLALTPYSWVIGGLCRKNDIEGAKNLLNRMIEKGPFPKHTAFNLIINALSKAGELEDAKEMLKLLEEKRNRKPNVYSYSVIISGYAKAGMMEEALEVLSMAKEKHEKLCPATLHSLIRGYCKLGEYEKALKLLGEMKDYGVEPNVDEYNKLIQSLCLKALDWKTAEKLLEEMKEKGLFLPGITRGLISAVKELEQEAGGSEKVPSET